MGILFNGVAVQQLLFNGDDVQQLLINGDDAWLHPRPSLLARLMYSSSSSYGITDEVGSVWRTNDGTKVGSGAGPFSGSTAILVDSVGSSNRFISLTSASSALSNRSIPNVTVCTWIKVLDCTNYGGDQYSFIIATAESNSVGWGARLSITTNNVGVQNVYSNFASANSGVVLKDTWHYVEVSYEGAYLRMFVDGQRVIAQDFYRSTYRLPVSNGSYGTVIGNWYALSNSNNRLKAYLYDYSILEGVWHTRSYVPPTKPI